MKFGHVEETLSPVCVLDAPSRDTKHNEHSNVIPVLPVQSRDRVKTGRTNRRRRREATVEDEGLQSQRSLNREHLDVTTTDKQHADSAAAILVSHYVTGQYIICISFTYSLLKSVYSKE